MYYFLVIYVLTNLKKTFLNMTEKFCIILMLKGMILVFITNILKTNLAVSLIKVGLYNYLVPGIKFKISFIDKRFFSLSLALLCFNMLFAVAIIFG